MHYLGQKQRLNDFPFNKKNIDKAIKIGYN